MEYQLNSDIAYVAPCIEVVCISLTDSCLQGSGAGGDLNYEDGDLG